MILVLLGTQNNSFCRLLEEIEKNIDNGIISEEVIVQVGYTKYNSNKMQILKFISAEEMDKLIDKARVIISHGGVGSILQCVKKGKVVIGVPRQQKYNEHVNDHQMQLIQTFNSKGYIIGIKDVKELENAIMKVEGFIPENFKSNTENLINLIENFIEG